MVAPVGATGAQVPAHGRSPVRQRNLSRREGRDTGRTGIRQPWRAHQAPMCREGWRNVPASRSLRDCQGMRGGVADCAPRYRSRSMARGEVFVS